MLRRDATTDLVKTFKLQKEYDRMNKNAQASEEFRGGSTPIDAATVENLFIETVAKAAGATPQQPPTYYRSYFERQTAAALDQGREITKAAYTGNAGPRQKENRNIQPESSGVDKMLGAAAPALSEGDVARCAHYCKVQGRSWCPVCKGEGFEAHQKRMGKSLNKARHLGRNGVQLEK
jgi:hypothetical protein